MLVCDWFKIIERSLPKKPKVKKDPSVIEKEEMEKIGKVWVNISRRDVPKHHRAFSTFHRKQLIDAKRFSENCQREVSLYFEKSFIFAFSYRIYKTSWTFDSVASRVSDSYIFVPGENENEQITQVYERCFDTNSEVG